mgnify:CR=1 FL=1
MDQTAYIFMDFDGVHGPEALTAPIREVMLPPVKGGRVRTLIVAKAVLASGLTVIAALLAVIVRADRTEEPVGRGTLRLRAQARPPAGPMLR